MTRKYKEIEGEIDVTPKDDPDYIKQIRTYKLITPLFGGGAEPQKADAITTVRGSEVRGHLRFWWRATRGGRFDGSLENMKNREEEIWGSAAKEGKPGPSPIKIFINKLTASKGNPFQAVDRDNNKIRNIGHPSSKDGYAAFPLFVSSAPVVWENVVFEIAIQYPREIEIKTSDRKINIEKDIEEALWAWETFGGIGARTRRGFGALQLTHINGGEVKPISRRETEQEILNKLEEYSSAAYKWSKGVPHIANNMKYKFIKKEQNNISAWRFIVQKLRDFRQLFRDQKNGKPFGRSHWPEADQIRRETGKYVKPKHIPKHLVQKFPRAKFGLPIVFEFKREDVAAGDPEKTMLQGIKLAENKYIERLASPLILRPIVCSDGAIGLALVLEWEKMNATDEQYTPPGGLLLKGGTKDYFPLKSDLIASEAKNIPPLKDEPDVLQAFLNYLEQ